MQLMSMRVTFQTLAILAGLAFAGSSLVTTPVVAQFSPTFEFLKALKKGDNRGVKTNLMKGANVNTYDDDGNPALVIATNMQQPAMVKYLLDQGAHVDQPSRRSGETALMRAASLGDKVTVSILLLAKADPNAQDRHGETPLIKAVRAGNRNVVKLLLDVGVNTDLQDYTGQGAIDYARRGRQRSIENMLVAAGAQ